MQRNDAPQYLQLNRGGSRARMSILRMAAIEHNKPRPPSAAIDWRGARAWNFTNWHDAYAALSQGLQDARPIWYAHTGEQFRNERDSHDIIERLPRGWYTDSDAGETAIGIVASLPHGRFIAGYRWTSNDERVYFSEVFTDEREAARRADSHAERFADISREDDARFQAAQKIEDDITSALQRMRELFVLRNVECMEYARDELRSIIGEVREMRDTLRTDFAGVL